MMRWIMVDEEIQSNIYFEFNLIWMEGVSDEEISISDNDKKNIFDVSIWSKRIKVKSNFFYILIILSA